MRERRDIDLLSLCLRDNDPPYVFAAKPQNWDIFRNELASSLGTSAADIRVVGSGRLGFSMKPSVHLRPFLDTSDIDVVVVDAGLFDYLWMELLQAAYPRPPTTSRLVGWLSKRRAELYTGWLTPLEITLDRSIFGVRADAVLQFRARWFNALKLAARLPSRRHSDIKGRLYRTWTFAELYHLNSLGELRKSLSPVAGTHEA